MHLTQNSAVTPVGVNILIWNLSSCPALRNLGGILMTPLNIIGLPSLDVTSPFSSWNMKRFSANMPVLPGTGVSGPATSPPGIFHKYQSASPLTDAEEPKRNTEMNMCPTREPMLTCVGLLVTGASTTSTRGTTLALLPSVVPLESITCL